MQRMTGGQALVASLQREGVRVIFEDGSRVVFRLSGTGTEGATLRVYLERYVAQGGAHDVPTQEALADLEKVADSVAGIRQRTGMSGPTVVT